MVIQVYAPQKKTTEWPGSNIAIGLVDPGFHTFSEGYSLGMVKMEAFDDPHFMHQTVRGGHTDHTGSIVLSWHASLILKRNSYVTGQS